MRSKGDEKSKGLPTSFRGSYRGTSGHSFTVNACAEATMEERHNVPQASVFSTQKERCIGSNVETPTPGVNHSNLVIFVRGRSECVRINVHHTRRHTFS
jgi:hypothetical protein|mmetsp:Transcript_27424/g.43707  ORF Transcript_27424/g.43707 Transcript_27424/m.43707 type:complete len:99 (+) Transcript_27424:1750-2046(+)